MYNRRRVLLVWKDCAAALVAMRIATHNTHEESSEFNRESSGKSSQNKILLLQNRDWPFSQRKCLPYESPASTPRPNLTAI